MEIFSMYSFDDLMNIQNLWRFRSISPKSVLILPKNFLNFRLDTIEKQGIINRSSYSSKSHVSEVFFYDSEITFLKEDTAFHLFLYWVLFIDSIA